MPEKKQTAVNSLSKGRPGPGRPKGVPNKTTTQLKEAILEAATNVGGENGLVGYLENLARTNDSAFATLVGKVLPLQMNHGDAEGKVIKPSIIRLVGPNEGIEQ